MARVEVKGIHRVTKTLAGGRTVEYHYAWRGGPRFWSSCDGHGAGGPDYWKAYRDAIEDRNPSKGLFRGEVILPFLASRDFQNLAERTRKDYRRSLYMKGGIDVKFGDAPAAVFKRPEVRRIVYDWRDSFASPRVADHAKTHLVTMVNWAVERGILPTNHIAGMKNIYKVDRSELFWTDAEIEAFCAGIPGHVDPAPAYLQRILITATETGLRPQDQCVLARSHIKTTPQGRRIQIRTQKRRRVASIPVTPRMAEIIDATPRDRLIILVGERGRPYSKSAYMGRQVARRMDEIAEGAKAAGIPSPIRAELHFYDCRGTAATRLFEADATVREIALHMGWSVETAARMIQKYAAMNPETADSVLVKLQALKDQ